MMKNESWIWTDELVKEYGEWYKKTQGNCGDLWGKDLFTHFKKSKGFTPIEKDFEILDFLLIEHQEVINMKSFGTCHVNYYLDKPAQYSIYRIKRLSDNSVWTVGDTVRHKESKEDCGVITNFELGNKGAIDEYIVVHFTGRYNGIDNHKFHNTLKVLIKVEKKILGTTHDGKVCYEGDTFPLFVVHPNYDQGCTSVDACQWRSDLKYFYDKAKAKEYINFNKPCISANEIISFGGYTDNRGEYVKIYVSELTKLATSKIQQP